MKETLEEIKKASQELADLRSVLQGLYWDQETMMPPRGTEIRARQIARLAEICHLKLTDPGFGQRLEQIDEQQLQGWERAGIVQLKRQYRRATRIPASLVREIAETSSLGYEAWVQARLDSSFDHFEPWLTKIFRLKADEARCLQDGQTLYEALLDEYEPGMTETELDRHFSALRPVLSSLTGRLSEASKSFPKGLIQGEFPTDRQEALAREVLTAMCFDWEAGRLDRSPHPFCTGLTPGDVRVTTRFSANQFEVSFFSAVHEGGHALYEQGLPLERFGEGACESISLGIHESQSRLWENQVARSEAFWHFWYGRLGELFPAPFHSLELEDFLRVVNRVEPSFIRVDADEVTYGLHVILRYELEKALLSGELDTQDAEAAWKEKMSEFLGIEPHNSAQGILQDTHWSQGLIGYFPTYLLGSVCAAQFFFQARRELDGLEDQLRHGQLLPLREWLRSRIHIKGRTVDARELLMEICGEPLNPNRFIDYLKEKYGRLYGLSLC